MGTDTGIEYADHSLNFWRGCQPVDECCDHCYAADNAKQYGWDFTKVQRTAESTWRQPYVKSRDTGKYKWKPGERIFVCSLSDFFHADADEWWEDAMQEISGRPDLVWLIVTKRIEQAGSYFNSISHDFTQENYPNLWIIPTCGTQKMADVRIPIALVLKEKFPWIKIGVSIEPMLEPMDLEEYLTPICAETCHYGESHRNKTCDCRQEHLDQIFIGCESGPKRRRCKIQDVRSVVDQCKEAGVACFVKQVDDDGKLIKDPEEIRALGFPQELAK